MLRRLLEIVTVLVIGLVGLSTAPALLTKGANTDTIAPQPVVARAKPQVPTVRPTPRPRPLSADTTVSAYPAPPLRAKAAILVDLDTGKVLLAQNADARLPMASTTKITTAVVALQRSRLTDMVTVSQNAATVGESTMGLKAGERLSVLDLLYGMLLNSGNDAAIALAEHTAGSEAKFVGMMNDLARRLGMRNTHYVTPHGLDEPDHFSSARDLATIAAYALRDPTFRKIVATENYHIPATSHNAEHWLANINRFMYWYPGVDGVKPGDTDGAGICQVISVSRDGRHLLGVVLNTLNLVWDMRDLMDFGLRDFRWAQSPDWFDTRRYAITGGSGVNAWAYYVAAGHYVRGPFLGYFLTHGDISTLGYPRTEAIEEHGQRVQYFQAAKLVYDPAHRTVYAASLGADEAKVLSPRAASTGQPVDPALVATYDKLGGPRVFGTPVTGLTTQAGVSVQYYQYGELALVKGTAAVVPVGDAALRLQGWFPAFGAADTFAPTMAPSVVAAVRPQAPAKKTAVASPARKKS